VAVIALSMLSIASGWVVWPFVPLLSIVIGMSFAGLTFLAHETLHGAVVRGRRLRDLVGWLGFLPFAVSPRLWKAWHNRVHHGHTNNSEIDPDAYPTLAAYERSRAVRVAIDLAPGGGRWTLILALSVGFIVQSKHVLIRAHRWGFLSRREHVRAGLETALAVGIWVALGASVGLATFVWVFVLPLLVANSIIMGFILTNHSLSPLTAKNDALLNSLSVTLPRFVEWLTLRFGYHVEHHIFPAMSSRHAPGVRALLRRLWPGRYQSMPIGRALLTLHRTGRVYKDDTTIVDPRTGAEWPTLTPALEARAPESGPVCPEFLPGFATASNR
jgi:fatty acid desaturase